MYLLNYLLNLRLCKILVISDIFNYLQNLHVDIEMRVSAFTEVRYFNIFA